MLVNWFVLRALVELSSQDGGFVFITLMYFCRFDLVLRGVYI